MAIVAFPTALSPYLDRASTIRHNMNVASDKMDDGSNRVRQLSETVTVDISCQFRHLSQSEKNTLVDFLIDNRANIITWTIDGVYYVGNFKGQHTETMTGNRYSISFVYSAADLNQ